MNLEIKEKLTNILELHLKWLNDEVGGLRADLSGADLSGAVLSGADLSLAILRDADLRCANLRSANLRCANLSGANLGGADLRCANLRCANLSGSDLNDAVLSSADLSVADLSGADLRGTDLSCANLSGADLRNAKNINNAYYDEMTSFFTIQCPEEGSFVAWKKLDMGYIAKLLIPEDAKRNSATTRKCRASKAVVLEIYDKDGNVMSDDFTIASQYDESFLYQKGITVEPTKPFDDDRWNECTSGIHFFITRKEAEIY